MKIRVTYTVIVETTEEQALEVQKALEAAVAPFDSTAGVDETDCEELEDDEKKKLVNQSR